MSDSVHEDLKKGIEDLSKQLRYLQGLDDKDKIVDDHKDTNAKNNDDSVGSAQPVNDEQLAKHLSKDRERELLWQQELAQRSAQLIREKQLAEERRQERELERNEWEARLKSQEEELRNREWESTERQIEAARLKEWEAEVNHERAREIAFQKELMFEQDLKRRTLDAMEQEHSAAATRLAHVLGDGSVDEVLRSVVAGSDIPSLSLSVNTVIDTQLSDEARRQRMAERDHERLTTLAQEREHQRELERHWAQQRVEDKIREEEARKIKNQVAKGEVMHLATLHKLKRRVLTEEEKAAVPNYVVSSLMRTAEESTDKACASLCIKILCRLMHGPDLERKNKVCDAMMNCMSSLRPLIHVFNRFQEDHALMCHLLLLLKLCETYSQSFVVVALQQGVWDVANSVPVPGMQSEPFRHITIFTPNYPDGAVRHCLEGLKQVLQMQPPDIFQCMRCLNGLKVEIPNSAVTKTAHVDFATVLFDAGILVQDEYVWHKVIHLLKALIKKGNGDMVSSMLVTGKGRTFITHMLKMFCIATDTDLIGSTFDFVVMSWNLQKELADTYVEFNALSALIQVSERLPALADPLYQQWEESGVGCVEVHELVEDVAVCTQWDYDLRQYLFDLAIRFKHRVEHLSGEPAIPDQAIAFLAEHRGTTVLKHIWDTLPPSKDSVLHVFWSMVQAKDEIQYAARLAEELMEKHFVKRLLEYSNDAACLRSLGHCIEVLDFCAQQNPKADEYMQRESSRGALAKAYHTAQTTAVVPPDVAPQLAGLLQRLGHTFDDDPTLEQTLMALPKELSEDNIRTVSKTILAIGRTASQQQQMRGAKGFPQLLQVLKQYPHVPEVELKAIQVMSELIHHPEDGLNAAVAEEFCDAGGVGCVLHILERYQDNAEVTGQCWEILWHIAQSGPEKYSSALKDDRKVQQLLAFSRTGVRMVAWVTKDVDPLDILRAAIKSIHAMESLGRDDADQPEDAPLTPRSNAKIREQELKETPAMQDLVVDTYILVQTLHRLLDPPSPTPSFMPANPGPSKDAVRLVEEGAARTLCRCLEAGGSCAPEVMILDVLKALQMLLLLGEDDKASKGEAERPSTPMRTLNFQPQGQGGPPHQGAGSANEGRLAARVKSHVQVQSRLETFVLILSGYSWSEQVCTQTISILYTLLMSVGSIDDDDLANRLVRSSFVEHCFDCLMDQGPSASLFGLIQCVSAVEDCEQTVWNLGGCDSAYSCYHLVLDPVTKATAVAMMANHAMLDPERRAWVANMGGLQMAQSMLFGQITVWEESWAAMRMLAALAEPSDGFVAGTIGQGCMYVVSNHLSRIAVLRNTRVAAHCLNRVLYMGLTFRQSIVDRGLAFNPPHLETWLTDEALTCSLELLVYRVHQLFLEQVHDIETMDFMMQYIAQLLGMRSVSVAARLLACNTRLLLTNILAYRNITAQIKKEAGYCLEELHAHAIAQAQANMTGTIENSVPVTQKPTVPNMPNGPVLQVAARPLEDEEEEAATPREKFETDPEDQEYLNSIGAKDLYEEMTSVLLAARPGPQEAYEFLLKFIGDKNARHQQKLLTSESSGATKPTQSSPPLAV